MRRRTRSIAPASNARTRICTPGHGGLGGPTAGPAPSGAGWRWGPTAALAAIGFTLTALLLVAGAVVVAVTRWRPILAALRSARWVQVGRIAVTAVVVLSAPGALRSFGDILSR